MKKGYAGCACRDWDQAYKELEMQRGYCAVSTKYSPALIQQQALASPDAFLKVRVPQCAKPEMFKYPHLAWVISMKVPTRSCTRSFSTAAIPPSIDGRKPQHAG